MQNVHTGVCGIGRLEKPIQTQAIGKLETIIDLDIGVGLAVVLEAHQLEIEHGGKLGKDDTLFSLLKAVFTGVVFVIACQGLYGGVLLNVRAIRIDD